MASWFFGLFWHGGEGASKTQCAHCTHCTKKFGESAIFWGVDGGIRRIRGKRHPYWVDLVSGGAVSDVSGGPGASAFLRVPPRLGALARRVGATRGTQGTLTK